jgi:hypothetical protein
MPPPPVCSHVCARHPSSASLLAWDQGGVLAGPGCVLWCHGPVLGGCKYVWLLVHACMAVGCGWAVLQVCNHKHMVMAHSGTYDIFFHPQHPSNWSGGPLVGWVGLGCDPDALLCLLVCAFLKPGFLLHFLGGPALKSVTTKVN